MIIYNNIRDTSYVQISSILIVKCTKPDRRTAKSLQYLPFANRILKRIL